MGPCPKANTRPALPSIEARPPRGYTYAMFSSQTSVLVTCPEGHESWVKVQGQSPPQPQMLVCPLCHERHDVLLPRIVKIEAMLAAER